MLGLVGPNGAGKSSTFSLLSLASSRSGGDLWLNGTHVDKHSELGTVQLQLGLCPQ